MMNETDVKVDFKQHKGKYVAIVDCSIVASGVNAKEVLDTAKKKHASGEIVLRKIPEEETLILVFWRGACV